MGLAHRIIPVVLMKGRTIFKGQRFRADRVIGHARQFVQVQARREVDELIILDVIATLEGRGPDLALVEELAAALFSPLTVGGGVSSIEDVRALLRAGADKVVIGTAAHELKTEGRSLIREAAKLAGSQAIVVAVDVKGGDVVSHCGTKTPPPGWTPEGFAQFMEHCGAGEILLQSVDREGTMLGYDLDLIRQVASAVSIPVVAHGGCSSYADMLAAIEAGASAVAAGALWQFTDATPKDAARYLLEHGIEARG